MSYDHPRHPNVYHSKNGQSTESTVVAGEKPLRIIINENTKSEHPCGEWFYYWQRTQESQTRQLSDRKLNALIKKNPIPQYL